MNERATAGDSVPHAARLGRWASVPVLPPRLRLRATVGAGAAPALAIYRPMRPRARMTARVAERMLAARAAVPRTPPLEGIDELLARIGIQADGAAAIRSSHGDRLLIGVASSGSLRAVLKVGPAGDPDLRHEADALKRVGRIGDGVSAPRVLWTGPWGDLFVLACKGVTPTRDPAGVSVDEAAQICVVLGRAGDAGPLVHGDLNPSNVLPVGDGFVLVDWEWCRFESDPLFDLAHFAARRGLLRREAPVAVVRRLVGRGSPGWTYLEAIGADPTEAPAFLHSYLMRANLPGTRGRRFRKAMWAELGRGLERSRG